MAAAWHQNEKIEKRHQQARKTGGLRKMKNRHQPRKLK
jgi:hypothetical protein